MSSSEINETLDQEFETHWEFNSHRQESLIQASQTHCQHFKWSSTWFEAYETLILQISYYPQLAEAVTQAVEFVRQKIISTHVGHFNTFLASQQAPLIDHHYDWLKNNFHQINWKNLSANPQAWDLITLHLNDVELFENSLKNMPVEWKIRNENFIDLHRFNKVDWETLSANPNAIELLKSHPEKINWYHLSKNPGAIDLLKAHPDKIHWRCLSTNPNAIEILKTHLENVSWELISLNPNAIELLESHPEKIDWYNLSKNPGAMDLLLAYPEHIFWPTFSSNPGAVEVLMECPEIIHWENLSKNPGAIELLKANPEKLYWSHVSANPGAIEVLRAHPEKIMWEYLCSNDYDYKREKIQAFNQLNLFPRLKIKIKI